jgi:vancomycin resistance protein YoaR
LDVRKTEYIVRSNSAPFSQVRLRTTGRRRRGSRESSLSSWRATATSAADRLRAVPFYRLATLPWRAITAGVCGGLVLLLLVGAVTFDVTYADRIHPGVHALGVNLSGMRPVEAQAALSARLSSFVKEPVVFEYDQRSWETTPTALGMQLDVVRVADAAYAVGRQGGPLEHLTRPVAALLGSRDLPQPPALLDDARVQRFLENLAVAVDRPLANAQLSITPDGRIDYLPQQTGRRLELGPTSDRLRAALMVGESPRVPLTVQETPPPVTDADLAAAHEQAERLLGSPVVLRLGDDTWSLGAAELASAVYLDGPRDRPVGARIKDSALEQAVRKLVQQVNRPASNARFEFLNGSLRTIRESQEGREVDLSATLLAVRGALESTERTVDVPARVTRPAVTGAQREQLGIRERIARGETSFAGSSPPKIHNIKLAASRVNGVVVPPGAMFSFNQELGPTTLESGYQVGWGIASTGDGSHATVPSVAGGICQVATTLFQPVFWGGYQLEERHHHLYWIASYGVAPLGRVGLDATVDEDTGLDFRFINSSPDYLLIQAEADDKTLAISLYGNKPTWDVNVEGPRITNRRSAQYDVVRYPEPSLPWGQQMHVESAGDGFDVSLVRTVADGGNSRTLALKTQYEPSQNLVVVGVRGAPAGAAEDIRASNAVARSNQAARDSNATTPAPAAAASAVAASPTAVATVVPDAAGRVAVPVAEPTNPAIGTAPAPALQPAPPSTDISRSNAASPSAPAAGRSAPAAAPAAPPIAAPAPAAPRFSTSGAPAAPTVTGGGANSRP